MSNAQELLQKKLTADHYQELTALGNGKLNEFIADAIELAGPDSVFISTGSDADLNHIKQLSIKNGEELVLDTAGHTCHFDGYTDQARDKARTKYLLSPGSSLGANLNSIDKAEGVEEIRGFFKDSMKGREMLVCFFCLGPVDSDFSIPCVQITDSPYVAHSEALLYRQGYEQFKKIGSSGDFFRFIHSEGKLDGAVSSNIDQRRVYIESFLSLFLCRLWKDKTPCASVVEPVGQLDDEHPDVFRHRHNHFSDSLGLSVIAVLHFVKLGDPIHQHRNFRAKILLNLFQGVRRIFDSVMQHGRRYRNRPNPEFGENL